MEHASLQYSKNVKGVIKTLQKKLQNGKDKKLHICQPKTAESGVNVFTAYLRNTPHDDKERVKQTILGKALPPRITSAASLMENFSDVKHIIFLCHGGSPAKGAYCVRGEKSLFIPAHCPLGKKQ